MKTVFVGQGLVAGVLSPVLREAGHVVLARERLPDADVVFVTVPDDLIYEVAGRIATELRCDQGVVHCSGVTEVSVLMSAVPGLTRIGGFHPLINFASPNVQELIAGSAVAIEAEPSFERELLALASDLRLRPIQLSAGGRPLYHAAITLLGYAGPSAMGSALAIWSSIGLEGEIAREVLEQFLKGVQFGQGAGLSGPVARADVGTIRLHRRALSALVRPEYWSEYRAAVQLQLEQADFFGLLPPDKIALLRQAIA